MTVSLLRPYGGFAAGASVTLPSTTEAALIAQGLATAGPTTSMPSLYGGPDQFVTQGGNIASGNTSGQSTPTNLQGPSIWPCISLGSLALASYDTNGTAPVAGTMYLTEIFVPYWNTWTGIGKLNGTTVGTDNHLVALYGSNGALIANSAVAGVLAASASAMQNIPFTSPVVLAPGRYFAGVQSNGTSATLRRLLSANGANILTAAPTGTFGTVPSTITVPTTHTNQQGVIVQLYT